MYKLSTVLLALYLLSLTDFLIPPVQKLISILIVTVLLASCSSSKKGTTSLPTAPQQKTVSANTGKVGGTNTTSQSSGSSESATPVSVNKDAEFSDASGTESFHSLQFKYGILLDVPVEEVKDEKLINFLESWYGTKYRLGGKDKTGIDCSAFVQAFTYYMYNISMPRTSSEQYTSCFRIQRDNLREGDLVFFKTKREKSISHVGVYLRNNKFVHASSSSGVVISDLNEAFYSKTFFAAGRIRE